MIKVFNKFTIFIILIVISVGAVSAQGPGSYNETIQFNGEDRTISMYVPLDYDFNEEYGLMVCLHGLGDNSSNFRNAIVTYLKWDSFMPNMIFACPDGGSDEGGDFYDPAGDEEIIQRTIDLVKSRYNIDEDKIILEGFSLGGRSALKYGLENPEKFMGMMLNTPAVQGAWDAMNVDDYSIQFKYENANKIPITFSYGENDLIYTNAIQLAIDSLNKYDGIIYDELVPEMGHTIANQPYIEKYYEFINNPSPQEYDAEVHSINIPDPMASVDFTPSVTFRNLGRKKIDTIHYTCEYNGNQQAFISYVELDTWKKIELKLPQYSITAPENEIKISISGIRLDSTEEIPDGIIDDGNNFNNEIVLNFYYPLDGFQTPDLQDFETENPVNNFWSTKKSGNIFNWFVDPGVSRSGEKSMFSFNTPQLFPGEGMRESIISPRYNIKNLSEPELSFDVAFNYQKYTPPYSTEDITFSDTLEVLVSTDRGITFRPVYRKAGAELATADEPILNPVNNISDGFFIPESNQWRRDRIDLSQFKSFDQIVVKFDYICGLGGSINIDDIAIAEKGFTDVPDLSPTGKISVRPNPADNIAIISTAGGFNYNDITIYDALGNIVEIVNNPNSFVELNVSNYAPGMYFIHIREQNEVIVQKLVIRR